MKHITRFSIAAVLLLAAAAAASAGTVTVKYQDPEKFMDVPYDEQDRTHEGGTLRRHCRWSTPSEL